MADTAVLDPSARGAWPKASDIAAVLDVEAVARDALGRVTAEQMLRLLQSMPVRFRSQVVRGLGLRGAAKPNRGIASQLLNRLRSDAQPARSEVLHLITIPLGHLFDCRWSEDEWATFLGADDLEALALTYRAGPDVVTSSDWLYAFPDTVLAATLCNVVTHEVAGVAPALLVLAKLDERAAAAVAELRRQFPTLPEVEVPTPDQIAPALRLKRTGRPVPHASKLWDAVDEAMRDIVHDHSRAQADDKFVPTNEHAKGSGAAEPNRYGASDREATMPDAGRAGEDARPGLAADGPGPADDADGGTDGAGEAADMEPVESVVGRMDPAAVTTVRAAVASTTDCWDLARTAAVSLLAALDTGRFPTDASWQDLEHLHAAGQQLRGLLNQHKLPLEVSLGKIKELAVALDAAAADPDAGWLTALMAIKAPERLDVQAAVVRQDAEDALQVRDLPRAGLLAVFLLAELAARRSKTDVAYAGLIQAQQAASSAYPDLQDLVYGIMFGDVTVPAATDTEATARASAATDAGAGEGARKSDRPADAAGVVEVGAAEEPADGSCSSASAPEAAHDETAESAVAVDDSSEGTVSGSAPVEQADEVADGGDDHVVADEAVDATGDPAQVATTGAEDAIDLSDLDALLAGGVGATLSSITKAGSRVGASRAAADTHSSTDGDAGHPVQSDNETRGARRGAPTTPRQSPSDLTAGPSAPVGAGATVGWDETVMPDLQWPLPAPLGGQLIAAGRFGLAADVAAAAGAPAASVAARQLPAWAVPLRSSTGPLAAAFAESAAIITLAALSDDPAGKLLAWAAAARTAVLAPSAGPASVLLDLAPALAGYPALSEVGQALAEASRAGVIVPPEAATLVGGLAVAESEAAAAAADAEALIDSVRHRSTKYLPANQVAQKWFSRDGVLGSLLALVGRNDPANLTDVRAQVVALRPRGKKEIIATHSAINPTKRNPTIVGGPAAALLSRWDEALGAAEAWVYACERLAEQQSVETVAWQMAPLRTLRQRLSQVREAALAELDGIVASRPDATDGDGDEFDQSAGGAASGTGSTPLPEQSSTALADTAIAARHLLEDTFSICDGNVPRGEEPTPAFVAHEELLGTDLALDAGTLTATEPDHGVLVPALVWAATAPPATAEDVYERRAARGDHDLTAALTAGLRVRDPRTSATLDRRRTEDLATLAAQVSSEVEALRSLVDTRRMNGVLEDGQWASLAARAQALDNPARKDLGRIRAEVSAVTAELDAAEATKVQQVLARVTERAAANAKVAQAADVLSELARAGQVASAEEYLQQVLSGGQLPSASGDVDHLELFMPAVVDAFAANPDLLEALHRALGREPDGADAPGTGGALAAALPSVLDPVALTRARRDAGRRAIGSWSALRSGGAPRGTAPKIDVPNALAAVLAQAGLEFAEAQRDSSDQGRYWYTLTGVRGAGHAISPALGSQMSPDGQTLRVLLVLQAPTPATLIEWMSGQPKDQTVLALWLSGPLSSADRRSIADAARGRPQPLVAVLDAALLGYLICQAEPRRSTFASLALPFTAASPYRDTPGDTPREMFYGRTEELDEVIDLNGSSFVHGGRQLGKSALLRRAARVFEDAGDSRVAVMTSVYTVGSDADPDSLWVKLWPRLAERQVVPETMPAGDPAVAVHDAVLAWVRQDQSRALLILLDEADAFLDADAADNRFTHVDWCRRIMLDSDHRVKIVFAGLHRTARFESLPNQPLSHFGRPVSIGPLRPQHAHDLLTRPLAALGFRFEDEVATPARVLAIANNMPALLQIFGMTLVTHLTSRPVPDDGPPQLITNDDIDSVVNDLNLREAFREKYVLTLNLDHRYLVIAYAVAAVAHERGIDASLSLSELSNTCRQAWPAGFAAVGADDFRGLVTECVDLGVLAVDAGRYRMRTPTVLRLLGTEEEVLEKLYSASEQLSMPSTSDAGSYRLRRGASRSPLTLRQLARLLNTDRSVYCVVGTEATGITSVPAALEAAKDDGAVRVTRVIRVQQPTVEAIRSKLAQVSNNATVLVVDARSQAGGGLRKLLDQAATDVKNAPHVTNVVVVAGPGNAAGWVTWPTRVDLARVDAPGLRLWCDEDNLPFHSDQLRRELLAVSGGWPTVLEYLSHMAATTQTPVPSAGRLLDDLSVWLSRAGNADLRAKCGLDGPNRTQCLADAFDAISELTSGDGGAGVALAELAELLELDDSRPHRQNAAAAGYTSLTEVVAALQALGLLDVASDGSWGAQATLASPASRDAAVALAAGAR